MVKKVFWRLVDICIVNAWIIFHHNNPNSTVKSQKMFRLKLAEELVQTLRNLKADPNCPQHLQGRKLVTSEKRLVGKHFAYKNQKRSRCVVRSKKMIKRHKIFVLSVKSSFVKDSALSYITHKQLIDFFYCIHKVLPCG